MPQSQSGHGSTALLLSPQLVGRDVMVVPSRQPPGWLGAAAGPSQFPSFPLKATTKNRMTLPTGTHSALLTWLPRAHSLAASASVGSNPTHRTAPPELPVSLPSLTLPRGPEVGSTTPPSTGTLVAPLPSGHVL